MTALTAGEGKNKTKTSADERHCSVCAFTASADRQCLSPTAVMGGLLQVHHHEDGTQYCLFKTNIYKNVAS